MITPARPPATLTPHQTVWGLSPVDLHDRFWAARGVQVIRMGEAKPLSRDAELFLLTDPHSLSIFRMGEALDTLSWLKPRLLFIRLHNAREQGYSERVITDDDDRFVRFERMYSTPDWRLGRVALTPHADLARMWQRGSDIRAGWRQLRRTITPRERATLSAEGDVYDRSEPEQVMEFVRELVTVWKRPDATIRRARRLGEAVWTDVALPRGNETRFIGPVWVGSGRRLDDADSIVGPAVLWDEPDARPAVEELRWNKIEPTDVLVRPIKVRALTSFQRGVKRLFDLAFASVALLVSGIFIFPFVIIAISCEDGWPWFFGHRRETMGGREFKCWKFRSMWRDADERKAEFETENEVDGPQFHMENDPRITRVGRFLRKTNLDELPQFWNVIRGEMSIVGPRPSPYKENQYCPPWREDRLSVRPGITGLWQIKRSRVKGRDFQEWIRYDIAYVENLSWKLDLYIIFRTVMNMLKLGKRPAPPDGEAESPLDRE